MLTLLKDYDSFLGFTAHKKEPTKSNTEKMLKKRYDYIIDGQHKILERRDFILNSVIERRNFVCDDSGSKKEYRIYDVDKTYSIITKTEFDFGTYIKKYYTSIKDVIDYLEFETAIKKAEKQEKEREEQQKRDAEKKAEQEEAENQEWLKNAILSYNDNDKINIVKSCYKEFYNIDRLPMAAYEILVLIDHIDKQFCKDALIERLHSANKASRKIFETLTGAKLPSKFADMVAFINSFNNANNNDETFYIRWTEKGKLTFKPIKGEHFSKYGLNMFIHLTEKGETGISFIKSGCLITCGKDKETAISYLDDLVNSKNADFWKHKDDILADKYGISPYCA